MSEIKKIPDIDRELGPELAAEGQKEQAEKEKVAGVFNQIFDKWLDSYPEEVQVSITNENQAIRALSQNVAFGNNLYQLVFIDFADQPTSLAGGKTPRDSENIQRVIAVNNLAPTGMVAASSSFRLSRGDNVVRRIEVDGRRRLLVDKMESGHLAWASDKQDLKDRMVENGVEDIENMRLAEDMGVNNQPVGLEDIEKLAVFLSLEKPPDPQSPDQTPSQQTPYDPSGPYI